jgi:hypothetical protein
MEVIFQCGRQLKVKQGWFIIIHNILTFDFCHSQNRKKVCIKNYKTN